MTTLTVKMFRDVNLAERQAKELFVRYTGGSGRIDRLYGPSNASRRAEIMTILEGRTVPKSKARWGEFAKMIERLYGAEGNCIAVREREIAVAACPDAWERVTDEYGETWRQVRN